MLVLAVHNLTETSAKIPFAMVVLLDCISKKLHPVQLKCRQIVPTSGLRSVSVWEAPDAESLREWLDDLLETDCKTEVFEIQEQFAIGLFTDVQRAADQVTATTRTTAAAASVQFGKFDERFKVSEQASAALKAAGDLGAVAAKNTRTAATNVSTMAKGISSKAMENERVAAATQATAQAFRGVTDKLTTSFKGLGLASSIWPGAAGGGGTASGSPSAAHAQEAACLHEQPPPRTISATATLPATSPAAPKPAAPMPKPTPAAAAAATAGPTATNVAPAAPAGPSSPNQADFFSLGDEDDAAPPPNAAGTGDAAKPAATAAE